MANKDQAQEVIDEIERKSDKGDKVNKDSLLIEIFTEELPPDSTENLGIHLGKNISEELLSRKLIDEIKFQSFATPRRLAVHIHSVSRKQKMKENLLKSCRIPLVFNEDKQPTQPLIKKLESIDKTIKVEDLKIKEENNQNLFTSQKYLKAIILRVK